MTVCPDEEDKILLLVVCYCCFCCFFIVFCAELLVILDSVRTWAFLYVMVWFFFFLPFHFWLTCSILADVLSSVYSHTGNMCVCVCVCVCMRACLIQLHCFLECIF